jgi:hypothetical protein
MNTVPFEVEEVLAITGRGMVVVARALRTSDFVLGDSSTLAECPIAPVLEQPRALTPKGNPRLDLFAFVLRNPDDASRFQPGETVFLRP